MTLRNAYICPKCPWIKKAHPIYGWLPTSERAVEVHQTHLCPSLKEPPDESRS